MMTRSFASGTLAAVLLVGSGAAAQESVDSGSEGLTAVKQDVPSAGIFIEPLLAIFGFYEGEIDVTLDEQLALGLWGQYFDYELLGFGISGYGVGIGAQYFFTGEVYDGAYVYPLLKFQRARYDAGEDVSVHAQHYGPLVTVGYQWNWGGFSLKLGGGLEYSFGELRSDDIDEDVSFEGPGIELDFAIGGVF